MNQRELSELRRRWRPEKNAVSRIYGCFVNSGGELVSDLEEPLGMLPQEEVEQYLGLLKKTMSGTLGKNLIDIVFSTQQVMDGEEHRLLMNLRDSELQDGEIRRNFYQKVIGSLDMDGRPYVLLLAHTQTSFIAVVIFFISHLNRTNHTFITFFSNTVF